MFGEIWTTFLIKPLFNSLMLLNYVTGDLGISIIILTILIKTLLVPLTFSQLKMSTKSKDLKGELNKLKKKYKDDKTELGKKQMELYKKHGVNPASGCLPLIVFSIILLALFRVFTNIFDGSIEETYYYFEFLKDVSINNKFLYLNLNEKDPFYILPVLTGIAQFFASKFTMSKMKKAEKVAEETESSMDDMAVQIQEQTLYILPVMTVFFTANFPAGLTLYWFVSSTYSFLQNLIIKKYFLSSSSDSEGA